MTDAQLGARAEQARREYLYGEPISLRTYLDLRDAFIHHNPSRSWGLTEYVEGSPFYIEKADTAVCIKDMGDQHCEVQGAFKLTSSPAYELGALSINKLIRLLGYRKASLTCFRPVAIAWDRQQYRVSDITPFDPALAPPRWSEDKHGKPAVLTMWRTF